jgi:pyridoxamine 5'-phosphate oxidase family protein
MIFTDAELEYLRSQMLGRLATVRSDGTLQNNPVVFSVDEAAGVIDIRGRDMGKSQKFRNVAANGQVAFVVDDLVSVRPWVARCLEIRGQGDALTGQKSPDSYSSDEVIRIHPRRIISWGLAPDGSERSSRNVDSPSGPPAS